MSANLNNGAAHERQHDLEAEYWLRRIEPPYHLVAAEIAAYAEGAERMLVGLVRGDPRRVAETTRATEDELDRRRMGTGWAD
jgi:hypothetical protein